MNTRFLETLVWLTRLCSFSRTAEKLNTTQPAISTRMSKLENMLGVQLYRRSERRFELTAAGRRIFEHAEQIVALSAELLQLAQEEGEDEKPIAIGVIEMVTMSWLPSFIYKLNSNLPESSLYIGTGTSQQLIQQLRDDEMDLVFVVGPLDEPNIVTRPICNLKQEWSANPDYFDCTTPIDIVQLSHLPIVLPRPGTSGYQLIVEYFRSYGIMHVPRQGQRITIDCAFSMVTALGIIKAGLAIMPLPSLAFRDELSKGALIPLMISQPLPPITISAAWKSPVSSRLISRLVDIGLQAAGEFADTCDRGEIWPA